MIRNTDQLQTIFPRCSYPQDWVRPLNQAMERFEINTLDRTAAFLGQIAVESGELNRIEEGLSYSPRRLTEVWPSRFPDLESTRLYARNPEQLANYVYADRLGNKSPGDGFLYRGRGLIQITGRSNYVRIGELLDLPGVVEMPDALREPRYAALSAAAYWYDRKLNELADGLSDDLEGTVEAVTLKVNGGTHGLENRIEYTTRALEVLSPDEHEGIGDAEDWLDTAVKELSECSGS